MPASTKPKILIVDSMNGARRIVARHLTNHGFQTLEASDASSGREMAVVNLPDVVLTDVRLGGIDALPLIRALRAVPALDSTPIVVSSAVGDDKTIVAAIQAGASDYIVRPVALEVLRARLGAALRAKKHQDELRARRRESEILFETLHAATESGTIDEILFRITHRLGRMMTASRCSIISVNQRRRVGTIAASMEDPRARGIQLDLSRYPEVLEAVRSRHAVLVDDETRVDLRAELTEVFRAKGVASILTVPIAFRDEILGVLTMHVREGEPRLTEDHVRFLSMVAFAIGGIVHNARRFEALAVAAPALVYPHAGAAA